MRSMVRFPGRGRTRIAALLASITAAGVCTLLTASAPPAAAASPRGATASPIHWAKAELVPGVQALNAGFNATVTSISCWGQGGCAAGGFYTDKHRHSQAFVAQERDGRWGTAVEVPGSATLNRGGKAQVGYVSCSRTSACVAVGTYTDQQANQQWFTVSESNKRWGNAAQVPEPSLTDAAIDAVWCAPGGLCAAGGTFTDPSTGTQAWVRTETSGRWHAALEVPGIQALSQNPPPPFTGSVTFSAVTSVSCPSAGNCVAGGQYQIGTSISDNGFPATEAFLVDETNGTWGDALPVPGLQALNAADPDADTAFVACPSTGNCTAAGYYQDEGVTSCDPPFAQPPPVTDQPVPPPFYGCGSGFVVNERHGTWGQATSTRFSEIQSLTCPATADCVAAGFTDTFSSPTTAGELISETNGRLGPALQLTKTVTVNAVSCASPGNCAAGGGAFVISESRGRWGSLVKPAGVRTPAAVNAVACPPKVAICIAGGSYAGPKGGQRAFFVGQIK